MCCALTHSNHLFINLQVKEWLWMNYGGQESYLQDEFLYGYYTLKFLMMLCLSSQIISTNQIHYLYCLACSGLELILQNVQQHWSTQHDDVKPSNHNNDKYGESFVLYLLLLICKLIFLQFACTEPVQRWLIKIITHFYDQPTLVHCNKQKHRKKFQDLIK